MRPEDRQCPKAHRFQREGMKGFPCFFSENYKSHRQMTRLCRGLHTVNCSDPSGGECNTYRMSNEAMPWLNHSRALTQDQVLGTGSVGERKGLSRPQGPRELQHVTWALRQPCPRGNSQASFRGSNATRSLLSRLGKWVVWHNFLGLCQGSLGCLFSGDAPGKLRQLLLRGDQKSPPQ